MLRILRRPTAAVLGVLALAVPASAHLDLRSPPSRYGGDVLKDGPCGRSGGQRSDTVTVLAAGATIEVVWDEYVDHPGHYRIAFDADGDDDFRDPVCLAGCATRAPEIALYGDDTVLLDGIADTAGGEGRAVVTLPDVACQRCTLQVIQVMYDKPPYVVPGNDLYYQCADLVLRRAACAGDCIGDGRVAVDELVVAIGASLGVGATGDCAAADADGDGRVRVDELVAAVAAALAGCGAPG